MKLFNFTIAYCFSKDKVYHKEYTGYIGNSIVEISARLIAGIIYDKYEQ